MKKPTKSFRELPPIRVRREPPTLDEAIVAAQDLADDVEQQIEIAAGLIGAPADEVRPLVEAAAKIKAERTENQARGRSDGRFEQRQERMVSTGGPSRAPRMVVVERRTRPTIVIERRGRPIEPRR